MLSADPIDLSQWSVNTWGTGQVRQESGVIAMSANGQGQGGDNVGIFVSPTLRGDLYADIVTTVNYQSPDENGDKGFIEVGNRTSARYVVLLLRNAEGNLYTFVEGNGTRVETNTVTVSNGQPHRIEVDTRADSWAIYLDGMLVVQYAEPLVDNASLQLGLRGDKDFVGLKLTGLDGIFTDYVSDITDNQGTSSAETINASQWTFDTYGTGAVSSANGWYTISANGDSQGGDNVVVGSLNTGISGDFNIDAIITVNHPSDHNGDRFIFRYNNDSLESNISFIRNASGNLYTHVEGSGAVTELDEVTVVNSVAHRLEANVNKDGISFFVDGWHIVTYAGAPTDNGSLKVILRGDKDYVGGKVTQSAGLFNTFTSDLDPADSPSVGVVMMVMPSLASVPVVQDNEYVLPDPVPPQLSGVWAESFAERIARGISATNYIVRCGLDYYDSNFKIDVPGGDNQFFVEYDNGAVELRVIPPGLPASQEHPYPNEVSPIVRNSPDVGQVSKPVKRTGASYHDPDRGIDVYPESNKFFIEYMDGTIEQRDRPKGGYIPSKDAFTIGGPDNSQPMAAYGPNVSWVLGANTQGPSPKASSELWYIGPQYVSSSGQLRIADPGTVFLQDRDTRIIVKRSIADGKVAMQKPSVEAVSVALHDKSTIVDLFKQATDRDPTEAEIDFWRRRTDKSGDALFGAIQYYFQQSTPPVVTNVGQVEKKALGNSYPAEQKAEGDWQPASATTINQTNWQQALLDIVEEMTDEAIAKTKAEAISAGKVAEHFNSTMAEAIEQILRTPENIRNMTIAYTDGFFTFPSTPLTLADLDAYRDDSNYVVWDDIQPDWLVSKFHEGGVNSIRIREKGSLGGIQVVLDKDGNIIPPGKPGTGSPDVFSPTNLGLITLHLLEDVL